MVASLAMLATEASAQNHPSDLVLTGVPGWTTLPVAQSNGDGSFDITNASVGDFAGWASTAGVVALAGDYNGDGLTDVALTGGVGWDSIPVAFSNGDGTFRVTNDTVGIFPEWPGTFTDWAAKPGALKLTGDFNGDGLTDIALLGAGPSSSMAGIIAFSLGDGRFQTESLVDQTFASLLTTPGAVAITGDFDGDGTTDIALTGGWGWNTIPMLSFHSQGGFFRTNYPVQDKGSNDSVDGSNFPAWAALNWTIHTLKGDFDGDGATDLVLIGFAGAIPIALSTRDGSFAASADFSGWCASFCPTGSGVVQPAVLTGDFDGDGTTDLALTGIQGWTSVPVALSNGDGSFTYMNQQAEDFAGWAGTPGAVALTGDFNGDGKTDILLTGPPAWASLPVAFSNGDGTFQVSNNDALNFASWSATPGAVRLLGNVR
jgi:hypothetical protein